MNVTLKLDPEQVAEIIKSALTEDYAICDDERVDLRLAIHVVLQYYMSEREYNEWASS